MDGNRIKNFLINELENKNFNGLYYYSQINFAYNSNRIEGSRLSEEQTKVIFDKDYSKESEVKTDEIIETQNHFKLFDYILKNVEKELSIGIILDMHKILKSNTSENYIAGKFKTSENVIGIIDNVKTISSKDVPRALSDLLQEYNLIINPTIEDIIEFHYQFEVIHPFNDGNGRVGRIIMFKECLKNNIIPFIISDDNKTFYLRGLKNYKQDKMFLIDTCKNAQDTYEQICKIIID